MDNKDLITQANDSVNPTAGQDLSAETVELSDKELKQVVGGLEASIGFIEIAISIEPLL